MVIDSQIHIWSEATPERPWATATGHAPHGPATYSAEAAIAQMDAAGVDTAVIIPPSFEGDRNDVALAAAARYPGRFLVNGRFDVSNQDNAQLITESLRDPAMIGVRLTFNKVAASWLRDATIDWFLDQAERDGIVVSLFPQGSLLDLVDGVAAAHPRLRLVVDHLAAGTPDSGWDHLSRIRDTARLGVRPNVAVKASALPISFPETYSPETVKSVVDLLLDAFGPERIFWGSDFTRYSWGQSYGDTLEVFAEGISHLSSDVQGLILGGGLRRWHGLDS
jgi:L-fuconolactonase